MTEINMLRSDHKYWTRIMSDNKTAKLELVKEYNGSNLAEENLKEHGFKGGGSVEMLMCGNSELLDYIENCFEYDE